MSDPRRMLRKVTAVNAGPWFIQDRQPEVVHTAEAVIPYRPGEVLHIVYEKDGPVASRLSIDDIDEETQ